MSALAQQVSNLADDTYQADGITHLVDDLSGDVKRDLYLTKTEQLTAAEQERYNELVGIEKPFWERYWQLIVAGVILVFNRH